jgi:beta-lactam-binding protein with PASTA domain
MRKKHDWGMRRFAAILAVLMVISVATALTGCGEEQVKVKDLSGMSQSEAEAWCDKNGLEFSAKEAYSNDVEFGDVISQDPAAGKETAKGSTVTVKYSKGRRPTKEEANALAKAKTYSDTMYMSKKAIYNQLVSSYGEGFDEEAAQYAVDHLKANYKKNALKKAETYQDEMHMSKSAIYKQLVSSYGEKFTAEEAQYAVDHLAD